MLIATRRARMVVTMLLLMLLSPSALWGMAVAASASSYPKYILVVASDIRDVLWAHIVENALRGKGVDAHVNILYLWKDYPGAQRERRRLADIGFLWRYDAVFLPDLNRDWMYGGRLGLGEVGKLLLYAKRGHLLLLGMNTLIQHWCPELEEAAGIEPLGISGASTDTSLFDIVYEGKVYAYNDTLGTILVGAVSARVVARFHYEQRPAITINRYGDGVVVFTAFNVVEAVVGQRNGSELAELIADILAPLLAQLKPLPPPESYMVEKSLRDSLAAIFQLFMRVYDLLGGGLAGAATVLTLLAAIIYAILFSLACTCVLAPERGAKVLKPLAAMRRLSHREKEIVRILSKEPALSLEKLASSTKLGRSAVCRALAWLIAKGSATSIRYRGITYYALPDKARLALIALNPTYRQIAELIEKEPGITLHELAARLGIPPDRALRVCRDLAARGVIEMRRVMHEYELYPTEVIIRNEAK